MASSSSSFSKPPRTIGKKSFAIELYFDEELESRVLELVNIFNDPETMNYKRCITLFNTPSLDLEQFEEPIRNFASNHKCQPISFTKFTRSPDKKLIPILEVDPTLSLRSFHVELYNIVYGKNVEIPQEYLPGFWAPRCLIGIEMEKKKFYNGAVVMMSEQNWPLNGTATSLGLVEYSEYGTKIYFFPLKNVSSPEKNA